MEVSQNGGTPKWMVYYEYKMENPIETSRKLRGQVVLRFTSLCQEMIGFKLGVQSQTEQASFSQCLKKFIKRTVSLSNPVRAHRYTWITDCEQQCSMEDALCSFFHFNCYLYIIYTIFFYGVNDCTVHFYHTFPYLLIQAWWLFRFVFPCC